MTRHRIPQVHVPVLRPADVVPHLGKPGHFKEGRSGRLVAESWFAHNGPSPAILAVLAQSGALAASEFLDAFLERKVELGDGRQPSQADVLALLGLPDGLAVMAVEGKVDESFGPLVSEWLVNASADKERRLACLPMRRMAPTVVFRFPGSKHQCVSPHSVPPLPGSQGQNWDQRDARRRCQQRRRLDPVALFPDRRTHAR